MHVFIIVHRPVEREEDEEGDVVLTSPKAHVYRAHSAGIALRELLENADEDIIRTTDRFLVMDCGPMSAGNWLQLPQHGCGLPIEVWKPIPPKPRWTAEVVS